jgi:hypothetical protein
MLHTIRVTGALSCHSTGKYRVTWEQWRGVAGGVEGLALRKGGDVGRCGRSGEVVAI